MGKVDWQWGLMGGWGWRGHCSWHEALSLCIAEVRPGQNTDVSALAAMEVVPWCAACRVAMTSTLKDGGINTRAL